MDWGRLRRRLADARFQAGLEVADLVAKSGLDKSTIYRIEDVEGNPDQKPDLVTIETWLAATNVTLAAFFAEEAPGSTSTDGAHGPRLSAAGSARVVIETLRGALTEALIALEIREQAADSSLDLPTGSEGDRTRDRSDPEG